jgi:hypothetical protein
MDAPRVASYDPWNALHWLVTGRTLGGHRLCPQSNLMYRETTLRLYTQTNTWFSNEVGVKAQIRAGQMADLAVLSADYLAVAEDDIRNIVSSLTVVGGKIVYAADDFKLLATPLPPAMPDWSPVRTHGGYFKPKLSAAALRQRQHASAMLACGCSRVCGVHGHAHAATAGAPTADRGGFWGALGCACWAV